MVIARGAIPLVVLGVGREVSGKTTRGQKVGLVLDLVVVGWVFFALSSVFTLCLKPAAISKVIGIRAHHSICFCRCCAETAVRRGGRYYCLGKCLWCEVRERHLSSAGMTEHVTQGRIGVFGPYAHSGSVNQTRITDAAK